MTNPVTVAEAVALKEMYEFDFSKIMKEDAGLEPTTRQLTYEPLIHMSVA